MVPPPRNKGKKANRTPLKKDKDLAEKLEERNEAKAKERALEYKEQGNAAFKAGNWLQAVEHFTAAIEEDPTDHVFFSNRSAANLNLKRTADAVEDARETVRLAPQWPKGWSRLGAACWADTLLQEASDAYKKGAKLDPSSDMLASKEKVDVELAAQKEEEKKAAELEKQSEGPATRGPVEPVVGIDLGTTYSAVAVWDEAAGGVRMLAGDDGKNTVPSYVAWGEDGERVIGDRAKAMAARLPGRALFDVKRLLGRKAYDEAVLAEKKRLPYGIVAGEEDRVEVEVQVGSATKRFQPEEVSAMVLGRMKAIAEKELGRPVTKAVVTVPAYFNDAQRKSTQAAGAIAGLDVLRIINEPTAAALGYGLDQKEQFGKKKSTKVLVFDLGGGTFDVSVLSIDDGVVQVIATGGDTRLGGEDFDAALSDVIVAELGLKAPDAKTKAKVKRAAEATKRALSANETAVLEISEVVPDREGTLNVTRAQFEKACAALFERCFATVKGVLKDAKLEAEAVDDVVLVGGSTRVPCIQATLSQYFGGRPLCKSIHPDEAVAYGAAVQGAILSGVRSAATQEIVLIDVTPLSLGIEVEGRHHSVIIPRNTSIPCQKTSTYTTTDNYQDMVEVSVYEGERPCVDQNRLLGEFEITNIEQAKKGVPQVEVSFALDTNGVLQVTARDKKTRAEACCTITGACKGLDAAEIARLHKEAEDMKEQDADYKLKLDLKSEIEELAYDTAEEDAVLEWLDGLDLGATSRSTLEQKLKELKAAQ